MAKIKQLMRLQHSQSQITQISICWETQSLPQFAVSDISIEVNPLMKVPILALELGLATRTTPKDFYESHSPTHSALLCLSSHSIEDQALQSFESTFRTGQF